MEIHLRRIAFFARQLGAREVWLYDPGAALGLAEVVAARNRIDGLNFVAARSLDVDDPPRVDVVVAEVLGNFAYEEDVLETLRDAQRFLKPNGTLIPRSLAQWAAPVTNDRFERDLKSWQGIGFGLDWSDAERMTRNNMYVFAIEPGDLLPAPASWDELDFAGAIESRRSGTSRWLLAEDIVVYGFALWWECTLAPGVTLSTSPFRARTHWDQIYLPLLTPVAGCAGDEIGLTVASETGGTESGIEVRWTVEQKRAGAVIDRQSLSIGEGFLG